jgi:hypothetical protein
MEDIWLCQVLMEDIWFYYTSYKESLVKENLIGREGRVTIVFSLQQNFVFHPFGTSCSTHSVVSGIFHTFDIKVYAVLL